LAKFGATMESHRTLLLLGEGWLDREQLKRGLPFVPHRKTSTVHNEQVEKLRNLVLDEDTNPQRNQKYRFS